MATEEELVEFANNFLLSSPPGEFMEVVTDVRALLPRADMLNDTAHATFREYNTEQYLQVKNGDHEMLITKYGEISDTEYLDHHSNQVVTFDHIKQVVTGTRAISGNDIERDVEALRAAFAEAAAAYTDEHYLQGTCAVYGRKEDGAQQVTICIASTKFNPNNFWNGRWRSVWTCSFNGSKVELNGQIRVNVHYYEDGNVQLNTDTAKSLSCAGGDPKTAATNALKAIAKAESDLHVAIEHSYATMGDTTFKALRRALPINRTKVDWDKIKNLKVDIIRS